VLFDGGAWEQFEGFDLGLSFVPIDLVALETIRSEEGLELAGTILASSLSSRLNLLSRVADRNGGIEAALRRTSLESGIPWDKSGEQARRLFVAAASMNESVWSDQKAISAGLVSSLERLDFDGLCLAHSSDNLSSAGSIMRFCARLARDGQLGAETEGPLLTRLEALRRECHAFLEIAMEGGRLGEAAVDKGWQDRWAAQREAAMQARRGVTSYLLELGIPREEVRKGLVAYAPAASGRQRRRVNAEGQHHQMLRVSLGLEEFAAGVLGCSVEQWELIRTRAAGGGAIGHREEQVLDALSAARDLEVAATLHRGGADEGARVPWWSLSMVKLLAMKGGESSLDVLGVAARADRERAAALGTGDVALAGKITERVLRDLEETMASDASDELLFHFDMQVIPEVVRAEERLIGLIDLVGASPELKSLMRSRSHSVRSAARQAEDWVVDDGRPVPLIRDDSVMKRYLVAVRNLRHVAWGVEVLMARVESCED